MTSVSDDSNLTSGYFPFSDKAVDGLGERLDELNRQEFCNQVGYMLLENRGSEGLVISIEGMGVWKVFCVGHDQILFEYTEEISMSRASKRAHATAEIDEMVSEAET